MLSEEYGIDGWFVKIFLPCLQAFSTATSLQVALRKRVFKCPVSNSIFTILV